jgi:hypothetical protein
MNHKGTKDTKKRKHKGENLTIIYKKRNQSRSIMEFVLSRGSGAPAKDGTT